MAEYKLSYTATEIDEKIGKIDNLAEKNDIPTKTSELTNDSGFITNVETDTTLTTSGVPADAKATGDAIDNATAFIESGDTQPTDERVEFWINTAEEYEDEGLPEDAIVQVTGTSTDKVMSQKAVTDAINVLTSEIVDLEERVESVENDAVSWLGTATKTEGVYSRWESSSQRIETSASTAWNTYRGAVTEGDEWNIKAYSVWEAFAVCFLNSSGGLVSTIPATIPSNATWIDETITVPSGAVEMVVNEEAKQISSILGVDGVVVEKTITTANSYLSGKVLLACGDSITDAYDLEANDGSYLESYAELTAKRHGMVYKKNAVSGSTLAYNADGSAEISTEAFSNTRYLNLPEFDYMTIWFGWNDGAYSTLGTINDTDNTTFYGAYKKVLEHLVTNNPTKKIGIVVQPLKANQSLISLADMAQAVKSVSVLYGVPCLDLTDYNKCPALWGVANATQQARNNALTFDGTHPNQSGHEFLSTVYESFILSL